jgi:A/G-specific adenine glycosylase
MAARQKRSSQNVETLRAHLLEWYSANQRDLPWRRSRDPYFIWVSEIMLQQTRVAVVIDRFEAFVQQFPTIILLARAPEQEVLALWSGLGYYRRARMLHQAAKFVAKHGQGKLPKTAEELRELPGIGAYTAAAIASIAHGEPAAVVDGNVERVLLRLAGWDESGSEGAATLRRKVQDLASQLLDPGQPGDFNQAMMELGATVCLPRSPQCLVCPLAAGCKTRGEHKTTPRTPMVNRTVGHALAARPERDDALADGEVLLEQRPATETVMPEMWQLPVLRDAEVPATELRMTVRHAIMQVNYTVRVRTLAEKDVAKLTVRSGKRRWVRLEELAALPLTGLTRKVLLRAHLMDLAVSRVRIRGN